MGNNIKQVYASLFIDENELQIVVSEFYNTRFNILRVDKVKMDGIIDYKITDYDRVVEILKKSLEYTSSKIGATIKQAILVLPAYNFNRFPLRVSVVPNGGIVSKNDIAKAVSSSLNTKVESDSMVINASIVKYYVNGIATRRLPEKEVCEEVIVDIDLLCADKEMAYSYVKAVSDAGVEVLDITLNSYAICKEAVLIEQSLNQNIILLDVGYDNSYLTLLSKGKLVSTEIIRDGLYSIVRSVHDTLAIPVESISRLIKYNVDKNSPNPDDAVFAWGDDTNNHSITIKQLSDATYGPVNTYLDKVLTMCKPIIESGETTFFVVGEGAKMNALIEELTESSGCKVNSYYPDTIGVRDSSLCAIFGSLFIYKEKALMNGLNVTCLDQAEYNETVDLQKVDLEGESLTSKIKKLFEQYRDKEENK